MNASRSAGSGSAFLGATAVCQVSYFCGSANVIRPRFDFERSNLHSTCAYVLVRVAARQLDVRPSPFAPSPSTPLRGGHMEYEIMNFVFVYPAGPQGLNDRFVQVLYSTTLGSRLPDGV